MAPTPLDDNLARIATLERQRAIARRCLLALLILLFILPAL